MQLTKSLREDGVDATLLLLLQLPPRLVHNKEGLDYVRGKALEMGVPLDRSCVYRAVEEELLNSGVQRVDKTVIIRYI